MCRAPVGANTNRFGIDLRRLCVAITTAMCRHCDRHRRRSYLVTIYDVYPLPSHLRHLSVAMQPPYCHINSVTIPLFSIKIATGLPSHVQQPRRNCNVRRNCDGNRSKTKQQQNCAELALI